MLSSVCLTCVHQSTARMPPAGLRPCATPTPQSVVRTAQSAPWCFLRFPYFSPWFRQRGLIIIELLRIHWNLPLMIVYAAPVIICMNRGDHRAAVYPLPQGNGRNALLPALRREAGSQPQGQAHPCQRDRNGVQAGADVDGHGRSWLLYG